ncbi:ankyrin repeat-containing domain protein [Schizophyllum commune]
MLAACNNHEDVVCLLLTKGADIDNCDKDGWTSLHWAVLLGQLSTARLLLERGANVNAVSNAYPTPLHIATHLGHIDIIRLLVDHGAALEARDDDGCTPLYHAVYNIEEEEAIALLLSFGSDPHTRADDGTTLLDAVGRESSLSRDAERAARVRELLMRAGCTEETGRGPLENGVQPEDTREGAESS